MKKWIFILSFLSVILFSGFTLVTTETDNYEVQANEQVVYITETGKKYHKGSCHHLKNSKIKTTKSKAQQAGYTACKVCKP